MRQETASTGYRVAVAYSTPSIRLATGFSATSVFDPNPEARPRGDCDLPLTVDAVVIGAGLAGLGAAIELSVRDSSVLLLGTRRPGLSALESGLGLIYSHLPTSSDLPEDTTKRAVLVEAAHDAQHWTERVISEFGVSCEYEAGEPGRLNPVRFGDGLRRVARSNGTKMALSTSAVGVASLPGIDGFEVRTTRGRVHCRRVVVTDGDELKRLLPKGPYELRKLTTTLVATEPLAERISINNSDLIRFTGDNRVVAAQRLGGNPEKARDAVIMSLFEQIPDLSTASADGGPVRLTNAWQATASVAAAGIPVAGTHAGVYYILAGSDQDMARMAWLGSRVGRWMSGESPPAFGEAEPRPLLARLAARVTGLIPVR